eukprot:gene5514-5578_t
MYDSSSSSTSLCAALTPMCNFAMEDDADEHPRD